MLGDLPSKYGLRFFQVSEQVEDRAISAWDAGVQRAELECPAVYFHGSVEVILHVGPVELLPQVRLGEARVEFQCPLQGGLGAIHHVVRSPYFR